MHILLIIGIVMLLLHGGLALTASAITLLFPIVFGTAIWFLIKHVVQEYAPGLNPLFEGPMAAISLIIVLGLVIL